jgi:hypothetical protein
LAPKPVSIPAFQPVIRVQTCGTSGAEHFPRGSTWGCPLRHGNIADQQPAGRRCTVSRQRAPRHGSTPGDASRRGRDCGQQGASGCPLSSVPLTVADSRSEVVCVWDKARHESPSDVCRLQRLQIGHCCPSFPEETSCGESVRFRAGQWQSTICPFQQAQAMTSNHQAACKRGIRSCLGPDKRPWRAWLSLSSAWKHCAARCRLRHQTGTSSSTSLTR